MSSKAMSLKAKINNYAKKNSIAAQVVMQNYMFERFLARLSISNFKQNFVIKGGMLIAAIVGLDTRSTMDLDTTLRNLPFDEEKINKSIEEICNIELDDNVEFKIISMEPIRKDDRYGGFCIRIDAIYDTIVTPLSIDISTGDIITPDAVKYEFSGIFDENFCIDLWGYNIETVIAEKVETILSRGVYTTRPRDYYDIFILGTTQRYDKKTFKEALAATAEHRGSKENIENINWVNSVINQISESNSLKQMWLKYQKKFTYSKDILYEDIIAVLKEIVI